MLRFCTSTSLVCLLLAACSTGRTPGHLGAEDLSANTMRGPDLDGGADFSTVTGDMTALPVHVVATADNAYAFGWGDSSSVSMLYGRPTTASAGDIFNCPVGNSSGATGFGPEEYDVPAANATGFLYVAAWCDELTTQGFIGEFIRGSGTLYSGDPAWEVCATGQYYDPTATTGPTEATVNQYISMCNAGTVPTTGTTPGSGGWVNSAGAVTSGAVGTLAVGEDNSSSTGGDFQIVCQKDANNVRGVDAAAKWMWYLAPGQTDAFNYSSGTDPTRAFLLFRLKATSIPIQ
jgi:hypothetical protein